MTFLAQNTRTWYKISDLRNNSPPIQPDQSNHTHTNTHLKLVKHSNPIVIFFPIVFDGSQPTRIYIWIFFIMEIGYFCNHHHHHHHPYVDVYISWVDDYYNDYYSDDDDDDNFFFNILLDEYYKSRWMDNNNNNNEQQQQQRLTINKSLFLAFFCDYNKKKIFVCV